MSTFHFLVERIKRTKTTKGNTQLIIKYTRKRLNGYRI
jgi:hypothetical protein